MFLETENITIQEKSKLYSILSSISNYILTSDSLLSEANSKKRILDQDYTSDDYLFYNCFKSSVDKFSFAEHQNLINLRDKDINITKKIKILEHYLKVNELTIAVLYPKYEFISWHHNNNSFGYNVLFTYSIDGDGFFKFYNEKTKQTEKIVDVPGWSAKLNYFGNTFLKDAPFWHCAKTTNYRISIGFSLDKSQIPIIKELCNF